MRPRGLRGRSAVPIMAMAALVAGGVTAPAHAAGVVQARMNGGAMVVVGTTDGDSIQINQPDGNGGDATVTVFGETVTSGAGCVQLNNTQVRCIQVFQAGASLSDGNDLLVYNGSSASIFFGGPGIDAIFGGGGSDEIRGGDGDDLVLDGGPGIDTIDGGNGIDDCSGEILSRCEL